MKWISHLLPVTVVVAIALFFLKEVVELVKRRLVDNRKRAAIRTFLARECELNNWVHAKILAAVKLIDDEFIQEEAEQFKILRRQSGEIFFRHDVGQSYEGWPLPNVHTEQANKLLMEVAVLDRSLFSKLETAYGGLQDLIHVRQSLINMIESNDSEDKLHLEAFPDYAVGELEDIASALDGLYQVCTGKKLTDWRVR